MSDGDIAVPEAVRQEALCQGAEGRTWLAGLGRLIRELEREWGAAVGPAFSAGSEAYVAITTAPLLPTLLVKEPASTTASQFAPDIRATGR